jgi:hypothetical protein
MVLALTPVTKYYQTGSSKVEKTMGQATFAVVDILPHFSIHWNQNLS